MNFEWLLRLCHFGNKIIERHSCTFNSKYHSFENGIYCMCFSLVQLLQFILLMLLWFVIMLQTLFLEETLSYDSFNEIIANCLTEPRFLQRPQIG